MKSSFLAIIITAATCMILSSCGTYEHVYSNFDRSTDFSQYTTFAWLPDSSAKEINEFANTAYDNDIVRNNAKNYIIHNLTRRGFIVSLDSPDLLVQLTLPNEKKERIVTYHAYPERYYYFHNHFYYPYYYPYYRSYTWYGWNHRPFWHDDVTSVTRTYVKGTITINIYDRAQKKLIWTGSAEGNIYDPAYVNYDVHPAIDRIMSRFPGRVKPKTNGKVTDRDRIVRANGVQERNRILTTGTVGK